MMSVILEMFINFYWQFTLIWGQMCRVMKTKEVFMITHSLIKIRFNIQSLNSRHKLFFCVYSLLRCRMASWKCRWAGYNSCTQMKIKVVAEAAAVLYNNNIKEGEWEHFFTSMILALKMKIKVVTTTRTGEEREMQKKVKRWKKHNKNFFFIVSFLVSFRQRGRARKMSFADYLS